MKPKLFAIVCLLVVVALANTSPSAKRDRALEQLRACESSNEASSRACKKQGEAIETLIEIYKRGDRSVLPALLRLSSLGEFYDEVLIPDTNTFLADLAALDEGRQDGVATSMAGGMFGLTRSRFDAMRAILLAVPSQSGNYRIAQLCLRRLEIQNAAFLFDYFPPETFTGRASEFTVHWYSRELYGLQEKPLWPASAEQTAYRFTWLRAFQAPASFTLTLKPDGTGEVHVRVADPTRPQLTVDRTRPITSEQVAQAMTLIDHAQFWLMPTQETRHGLDGSEWILESAKNGSYHVVDRWSPGKTTYAEIGLKFIALAGYESGANDLY